MKTCRCCDLPKPLESFFIDRSKLGGRTSYCKECDRKRSGAWKAANHDIYREQQRMARLARLEAELLRVSRWKKSHPENAKASTAGRRSKKGGITAKEIRKLLELQSKKCAICGIDISVKYHLDHIVPLKLGGGNDRGNIQLLCPPCNLSKGAILPEVFARRRLLRSAKMVVIPEIGGH